METVIYADILFIINLIIDGLCLTVTTVLQKQRAVKWRLVSASVLGGVYSVGAVALSGLHTAITIIVHFSAAVILCSIAIKPKNARNALTNAVCFFFVNALLGGVLYSIYTLCGSFAVYNGVFYAEVSPLSLIASGVVVLTVILFCITRTKRDNEARYCDLTLEFRKKRCTVSCIYDSGNLLICPYTALPVAVISRRAAAMLFSKQELDELDNTPAMIGVRPLPVNGVCGSGMLPSFVPDKAEVRSFGEKCFTARQLCIAIKSDGFGFGKTDGIVPI